MKWKYFFKKENLRGTTPPQILELKSIITKMRNSLVWFKGRLEQAEERISKLKGRTMEITESEEKKEKTLK